MRSGRVGLLIWLGLSLIAIEPALAQSVGQSFCQSDLADTLRNVFTVIQFGGPLIGGTIFVVAIIGDASSRKKDTKYKFKDMRNNGLIWGVIVAPLATVIIQFILNNIVVGGSSCSF